MQKRFIMKKIFVFLTLFVFAFLSSCDSKDNDDSQSTNFLKATINGTEVVFDTFAVEKRIIPMMDTLIFK